MLHVHTHSYTHSDAHSDTHSDNSEEFEFVENLPNNKKKSTLKPRTPSPKLVPHTTPAPKPLDLRLHNLLAQPQNFEQAIQLLRQDNLDPMLRDVHGETSLDIAVNTWNNLSLREQSLYANSLLTYINVAIDQHFGLKNINLKQQVRDMKVDVNKKLFSTNTKLSLLENIFQETSTYLYNNYYNNHELIIYWLWQKLIYLVRDSTIVALRKQEAETIQKCAIFSKLTPGSDMLLVCVFDAILANTQYDWITTSSLHNKLQPFFSTMRQRANWQHQAKLYQTILTNEHVTSVIKQHPSLLNTYSRIKTNNVFPKAPLTNNVDKLVLNL